MVRTGALGRAVKNVASKQQRGDLHTSSVSLALERSDEGPYQLDMLKYQKWLSTFVVALALWLLLIQYVTKNVADGRVLQVVYVLPMYALVTFGAYSLAVIAMSVMAVTDCPEAAKELDRQVIEAKEDLRKRGLQL